MSDAIETPPVTPTSEKPKRTKKAKAPKPPKVEKPKRERKPVVTLLARIKAMGENHVDAYRILASDEFDAGLRAEFHYEREAERARRILANAHARLKAAETDAARLGVKTTTHTDRLNELAASIEKHRGSIAFSQDTRPTTSA